MEGLSFSKALEGYSDDFDFRKKASGSHYILIRVSISLCG